MPQKSEMSHNIFLQIDQMTAILYFDVTRMRILKSHSHVDEDLCHLGAGERVAVLGVHVATDVFGQGAPNFDVLDVVFVELLCYSSELTKTPDRMDS